MNRVHAGAIGAILVLVLVWSPRAHSAGDAVRGKMLFDVTYRCNVCHDKGVIPTPGVLNLSLGGTVQGLIEALGEFLMSNKYADTLAVNPTDLADVAAYIADGSLPPPSVVAAVEYYHAVFGHYFITAIPDEISKLDTGVFVGWARTGQTFNVYTTQTSVFKGLVGVCRFFTTAFPPTSSHFYAPRGLGCEATFANADWQFEGDVFFTPLPDAGGGCPSNAVPVYRLYNNGQGGAPNHRFTTSMEIRNQMLASGFIAEGAGIGVGMCSPN
jgi:Repeat of unknown function (DUF5648)